MCFVPASYAVLGDNDHEMEQSKYIEVLGLTFQCETARAEFSTSFSKIPASFILNF